MNTRHVLREGGGGRRSCYMRGVRVTGAVTEEEEIQRRPSACSGVSRVERSGGGGDSTSAEWRRGDKIGEGEERRNEWREEEREERRGEEREGERREERRTGDSTSVTPYQSAPPSTTRLASSASRAKSAASSEGEMIALGAIVGRAGGRRV